MKNEKRKPSKIELRSRNWIARKWGEAFCPKNSRLDCDVAHAMRAWRDALPEAKRAALAHIWDDLDRELMRQLCKRRCR